MQRYLLASLKHGFIETTSTFSPIRDSERRESAGKKVNACVIFHSDRDELFRRLTTKSIISSVSSVMQKLRLVYDFSNSVCRLMLCYFCGKKQRRCVSNRDLATRKLKIGRVQGSWLSSMAFSLYIKYVGVAFNTTSTLRHMYADDGPVGRFVEWFIHTGVKIDCERRLVLASFHIQIRQAKSYVAKICYIILDFYLVVL